MIALVTGGNRGIGLEVCRQLAAHGHEVILGARDKAKGERVANGLRVVEIDVADDDSVHTAAAEIEQLDVLVNNAAILYDTWARASTADLAEVHDGARDEPLRRLAHDARLPPPPAPKRAPAGGQRLQRERRAERDARRHARLQRQQGGAERAHADARERARRHPRQRDLPRLDGHRHGPGRTAGRPGRGGVVWAAELPDDGPTGGFFRDGRPLSW